MSDRRDPSDRKSTNRLPRAELAPISGPAEAIDDGIETLVSCPWCGGCGMVSVVQRAEWNAKYLEAHTTTKVAADG